MLNARQYVDMSRLILTFPTLFQVLAADKLLRGSRIVCRPTPTPQGLSADICGVSVELLDPSQLEQARKALADNQLPAKGEHQVP
jgi:hypothetical protein